MQEDKNALVRVPVRVLSHDLSWMANREQKRQVQGSITKKRSEPEKRRIAMRQNWKCINPDGICPLREDEIDHVIPSSLGGADTATSRLCARPVTGLEPREPGAGQWWVQ